MALGCGETSTGSGSSDLVCDPGKGVCFSDDGQLHLCSQADFDRISPVGGSLVNCGKCDDLDPTCTEEAYALCDELFTGSQLVSCGECGDSTATRTE